MASEIYPEIKVVSTKEYGIKYLKAWARLLNYPYKIRVILAVRIHGNKTGYYFRILGPFVIGLGPDSIISSPRPELTLLALRFRQEPSLSLM